MRFKKLLPRTLLVISLVLVIAVILTTRSAFVSAEEDVSAEEKLQIGQHNSEPSQLSSSEKCPCIAREDCPREYGHSALDITQIGIVSPCPGNGTIRCCGVTISVVQKSDDDAEKSMIFSESPEESAGEDVEATTEEFNINFENEAEEMQVDHVQEQSSEIIGNNPSSHSNETSSSENFPMINMESDLEPGESVLIKTFDTQSTDNKWPRGPKTRRRKIKTSVNSVLTLNGNENPGSNVDENNESFHNTETPSGNNNPDFDSSSPGNPGKVIISAFAEDTPSSRLATTTIILDSTSDKKMPNLLSRTRKLTTAIENTETSVKNSEISSRNDSVNISIEGGEGFSPIKPGPAFTRTNFFSSKSQAGSNTRSSSSTTGTTHFATSVSGLHGKFKRPSFSSLPQATLSSENVDGGIGGFDLISASGETLHVSPLDQKDKLESTESPIAPGGSKKIISFGFPSHTSTFGTNSNSTSSKFLSARTKARNFHSGVSGGASSSSQTSPNLANITEMNLPQPNATKSFNNDALTSDTQTPKTSSSSLPSMPVFVPKIRPFLPKRTDGTSSNPSISISPNKKEQEQDAKTTTTDEILVQKGNKSLSFSLVTPPKVNLPVKTPLKSHSLSSAYFPTNSNTPDLSVMQNSSQRKLTSSFLPPSSSSFQEIHPTQVAPQIITTPPQIESGELYGKVNAKPGVRRRKIRTTTTTPAPLEINELEKEEDFPRITLSRPLLTQTNPIFPSSLLRKHSGFSKNKSNAYESVEPSIPVSTAQTEPITQTVETNDITSPPAKTSLNRGYRRRVRPLAKVHLDDSATSSLSTPPTTTQILTMPTTGSVTTPQPRVHAHPSSSPENQSGNDENTNDFTPATFQQKDIDLQKGNKKTNDDISTSNTQTDKIKHGHFANKLQQPILISTHAPVLTPTENILFVKHNVIDKSQNHQDFVSPPVSTDSSANAYTDSAESNNGKKNHNAPRRKVVVNRIFRTTTTTAPLVLTRPNGITLSKQEVSHPELSMNYNPGSVTPTPASESTTHNTKRGKYPVQMTSTYSRIRVNKQNEEEAPLNHGITQTNTNHRRFRIPTNLQVIQEPSSSPSTTPTSISFSFNNNNNHNSNNRRNEALSTTGVKNSETGEEVGSEDEEQATNYDGGSMEQQKVVNGEGTESYDLVLDKEARKSMQNQTTDQNSFPPPHAPSPSSETKFPSAPEPATVLPQRVNHHRHMVKVKRRRRPVTVAPVATIPAEGGKQSSMNVEEGSEEEHLIEQQPVEALFVKLSGEENVGENINLAAEGDNERQVGEKNENVDEGDVDIDLKVNIDVTVDGNVDDKAELEIEDGKQVESIGVEYEEEVEEVESAGEQEESRVHANYVKGKFSVPPLSFSSPSSPNDNDAINYNSYSSPVVPRLENNSSKSLTSHAENEVSRNSGGIKSSVSVLAVSENEPLHSTVPATHVSSGQKIRKPQKGNSTAHRRFPASIDINSNIVNKTRSSKIGQSQLVDSVGKQVGHSFDSRETNSFGKASATKTNEMRHSTHNANSPTRFSYSSTNLNTGTGNNAALSQSTFPTHHLIRRPGEDIKQSHHERFNVQTLDKNNNIQDSNASNDNNESASGIRTRANYRLTGGLSPTKIKTTTQLPPPPSENTETDETTLETPFVFPPFRKSQSVLIVTSTPEPLSTFNPTGLRYNPALKYRSTTTTPASFTTTSTNNPNNVGNVVEFHSQPTRTAPTIPSVAPASFNIVNTFNRNRNTHTVDSNKAAYNSKHIAEHEQSRFSVSQVKSQVSPSVNNNVTEPSKRIRKKNKTKVNAGVYKENDVYIESINSPGSGTKGMNTFNNSPKTSYNNEQDSNVKQVTPNPLYTSFSTSLENEAMPPPRYLPATTTTTENAFSYQIVPTETPFRYIPTSPIPPQVSFSPAPSQKARPVSKPAISVQYQDSHSSKNPLMTDEFTEEKNSRTSSRFSVPEKFDFSGWRVTNALTTVSPIILTTTETPTTSRPAVRVSYNEIQNPPPLNSIRIASTPQNVPTTAEHKYPEQMATSFAWSPAEFHSVSSGHYTSQRPLLPPQVNLQAHEHLRNQPQQTHHIHTLPEFQNLNVQKHHTQNAANYQLETKPLERPPAFDNQFNYQLTSNGQSYSIQLAETQPISNNAPSTKLSAPNNNVPGVVASSSPSIVPAQHHFSQTTSHSAQQSPISFHSPTTQLNLQTLSSHPSTIPQTKQHQQQQQQMPVLHTQTANSQYQTNAFQPPIIEEDKRQNYFQPSGPTSYTLPILPQHNPKVPNTVSIQFGEDIGVQNYKENIRNQNQTAYQQYSQPAYSQPSQFYSDNNSPPTAFVYNQEEKDSNKNVFPVSPPPASSAPSWQSQSQFSPPSTPHYYPEQFSASKWNMNNSNTNNINNFNTMKQTTDHYNLQNQQTQAQNVYHSPNGFKHSGNQSPLPLKQIASPGSMFYSPEPQRQPLVNVPHPDNGNMNNIPSSYQYNSAMPVNQNIPMENFNNNFQYQQQAFRVNGAGKISGSQQPQHQAKPGLGVSFSSQGYNGNPIVNEAVASPILHGLPVSVQKQLPPIHQKEYQQHMQISQNIMNHMNRYSGRTSRAKNINGGQDSTDSILTNSDLNASGSDTLEVVSNLGDETYNTNIPVPQEIVTILKERENTTENMRTQKDFSITNNSTNSDSNEHRLKGGLEESNPEKLMVEESMVKEVVDKNVRGAFNSALLLQNNKVVTESPNSESEKNRITSDVSGEMKTKAMLVPDLESDTKGVEAEARGVGSNIKESSSFANLNPNMNFTAEGNNKTEFTPPKVIQGGFVPILPYSEKDPGPILVKMQPSQEKILSPTQQQISAMNRLNHPNLIQQSNFRSQLHEQINKLYVNTVKSIHHPK